MKVNTSVSLDQKLILFAQNESKKLGLKFSPYINYLLQEEMKSVEPIEYIILTCEKCGATYSSKFNECPACDKLSIEEIEKAKVEASEIKIKNRLKELQDQEAKLQKRRANAEEWAIDEETLQKKYITIDKLLSEVAEEILILKSGNLPEETEGSKKNV